MVVLVHGVGHDEAVPKGKGIRIVRKGRFWLAARARNVFVLVSAPELREVSKFVAIANRRRRLRALFVRDNVKAGWLPHFLERAGVRAFRKTVVYSDPAVPRRVLSAWRHGAQKELIAEACAAENRLFIISCAMDRYEVRFDRMPALKCVPEGERGRFAIDEDGSYIHWPGPDVHVDVDAIRAAVDPRWRAKALAARAGHSRRYGATIAKLRAAAGLRRTGIAGLSETEVRRVENGRGITQESMRRLAAAHGMAVDDYLREVAEHVGELQNGT
jgi:hypothetical protein